MTDTSKRPCPGCERGETPALLDADGTLSSISGRPGKPGHGIDDFYWFCSDYKSAAREAIGGE